MNNKYVFEICNELLSIVLHQRELSKLKSQQEFNKRAALPFKRESELGDKIYDCLRDILSSKGVTDDLCNPESSEVQACSKILQKRFKKSKSQ